MKKSPHIFAALMAMCGTAPIKSDFIALNTLQQPGTGNTVYLLYDIPVSEQRNREIASTLEKEKQNIDNNFSASIQTEGIVSDEIIKDAQSFSTELPALAGIEDIKKELAASIARRLWADIYRVLDNARKILAAARDGEGDYIYWNIMEKVSNIHRKFIKTKLTKSWNEVTNALEKAYAELDNIHNKILDNLPDLRKQQNDLATIVKTCGIYVINDNRSIKKELPSKSTSTLFQDAYALFHQYSQAMIGEGKTGHWGGASLYQTTFSPTSALDIQLLGRSAKAGFQPISSTTAYFYELQKEVSPTDTVNEILATLEILFTRYKQKKVIVTADATVCVNLANALTNKKYTRGSLVTGSEIMSATSREKAYYNDLVTLITGLEQGVPRTKNEYLERKIHWGHWLPPLDLMAAFAPELAQCRKNAEEFSDAIWQGNIDHVRKQLPTIAITPAMIDMARKATEENDALMKKYDDIITLLK